MKQILTLVIAIGLFACSSIKTNYDFDKQIDFTKYKTYSFSQDDLTSAVGPLNRDRIIKNAEIQLAAKGFTKSDTPDAIVDIFIKKDQKVEATATTSGTGYYGYGRYGYGSGYSTTNISYDEYTEGTMFISIIDNATQKIIWQGTGTKTLSETAKTAKVEANIEYAIQQIMLNYPPKSK